MSVVLPRTPGIRSARLRLLDWGSDLTPPLGGPVQRVARLGTRFAVDIELPPLAESGDGRIYLSRLRLAKVDGALLAFPQFGLGIGAPGVPLVKTATAGGSSVPMKGLTPYYMMREGQFFSIIHGGRRYVHHATAQAIADAAGDATVPIFPMLRTNISVDDVVEIAVPMIEGILSDIAWDVLYEPYNSVNFSITEAE